MPKLTIGMCCFDDYDGVYFTCQSLRTYLPFCKNKDNVEILVVDNNPESKDGEATKNFCLNSQEVKYIPYAEKTGTSVRNQIFNNASGEYCLCLDSHVLLLPNSLTALMNYYENNPHCKDIVQGPMMYDSLKDGYSHFIPEWGDFMYGRWGSNKEALAKNMPFEIPMQGLGLFSCKTENWLGFNEHFKGFGGEEGYIHEKFRQNGGRAMCIPQLRWLHRFGRPKGIPYPNTIEDRAWNYFIGWLELTGNPEDVMIKNIYEIFQNRCKNINSILEKAIRTIFL